MVILIDKKETFFVIKLILFIVNKIEEKNTHSLVLCNRLWVFVRDENNLQDHDDDIIFEDFARLRLKEVRQTHERRHRLWLCSLPVHSNPYVLMCISAAIRCEPMIQVCALVIGCAASHIQNALFSFVQGFQKLPVSVGGECSANYICQCLYN